MLKLFDLGFDCAYKKRTGSKPDGCATFWRKSMFSCEFIDDVEYQVPKTFLDRDNVGLIVRLVFHEPVGDSKQCRRLLVANTHLLFNPARGDIKLCQLALLLARLRKVNSHLDYTVCVC